MEDLRRDLNLRIVRYKILRNLYSDSDEVNTVQMDIRTGHDQTISKILKWVESDGDMEGKTVCDCGCGVGSLAIPLAKMGCKISASDMEGKTVCDCGCGVGSL